MYIYPVDLISIIHEEWDKNPELFPLRDKLLPNEEVLKDILEICYHASLLTEELRKIRFNIVYCPSKVYDNKEKSSFLKFSQSRDFNVMEILKLAPATDPSRVYIGIENIDDDLRIWGLINAETPHQRLDHTKFSRYVSPLDFFSVSTYEPGHINVSCRDVNLVHLANGEIIKSTRWIFYYGAVYEFFESAIEKYHRSVCKKLGIEVESSKIFNYATEIFMGYIHRLLNSIRKAEHGAIVIFIPEREEQDYGLAGKLLIKYEFTYNSSWWALVNYLVTFARYTRLNEIVENEEEVSKETLENLIELKNDLEKYDFQITESIKFLSSFGSVDGAIVITNNFKVLGFGAEVIVHTPSLRKIKAAEDAKGEKLKNVSIQTFGTRHRSAVRFCSDYESSVSFVISQDRSIKAIKKIGSDIVLWENISIGPLGA